VLSLTFTQIHHLSRLLQADRPYKLVWYFALASTREVVDTYLATLNLELGPSVSFRVGYSARESYLGSNIVLDSTWQTRLTTML
jgi:hypothetical protein